MRKSRELLKTEIAIAYVLRFGVIFCGLIIAFGLGIGLVHPHSRHGLSSEELHLLLTGHTIDGPVAPHSISEFKDGLQAGSSSTLMALGLILLIALPVLRVALTVFIFLLEKDYPYVVITLVVLSVLLSGLIFGKAL